MTVEQALQFDDSLWRRFTALHEAGHAIVALATGKASVSECVIAPTKTTSGDEASAYTELRWDSLDAHLTLLYGGAAAQQRWLHEQQLWSPLRDSAVEALASHDYAAAAATGAAPEQLRQAQTTALALRDRHWAAILAAGALLERNGRVSGETLSALLHQPPATASPATAQTPLSPPVAAFSHFMDRARQIAAESQRRASHTPDTTAQLPHAQSESLGSQQPGHRHIR
ncbi:hypothetical protein OG730_41445 (plasmid) [Streptomyces sp. NBC_01298]|uniref:hypothetical protein n=1 Tax=Streptomyces sp. NBC_01298 TaxID=2903817 RepID=UPI002E157B85|nr:hypothetical protein OG730_42580 [Streptomyces sp. NBC_01298]WSK25934.1 hypothetical protein OG730_41445 [Streptomyces sp. NBC_01298]